MNRLQTFAAALLLTVTVGALAQVSGIPSVLSIQSLVASDDVTVGGDLTVTGTFNGEVQASSLPFAYARLEILGGPTCALAAGGTSQGITSCSWPFTGGIDVVMSADFNGGYCWVSPASNGDYSSVTLGRVTGGAVRIITRDSGNVTRDVAVHVLCVK